MKLRIKYDVGRWLMGKWKGRVIYPFVLFSQAKNDVSNHLFRHEMQHVYQIRKHGVIRFYLKYFYYGLKHGYRDNPFELEAVGTEIFPLTDEEKRLKVQ